MKAKFWDVKTRKSIEAEVTELVTFDNGRSAFKAVTADGRSLTRFVSKADAEKYAAKAPAKKCCCKKK
ncbi:MAG: hypothetical protein MJ202_03695 [Lentisphaeria bacterium]|nr:hypothetical protein [Lentisphaeria bacterium]